MAPKANNSAASPAEAAAADESSKDTRVYRWVAREGATCAKCGDLGHAADKCTQPYCSQCKLNGHRTGQCSSACSTCGKQHSAPCRQFRCSTCFKYGHLARFCPQNQCVICKRWGHMSGQCPACQHCHADHAPGACPKVDSSSGSGSGSGSTAKPSKSSTSASSASLSAAGAAGAAVASQQHKQHLTPRPAAGSDPHASALAKGTAAAANDAGGDSSSSSRVYCWVGRPTCARCGIIGHTQHACVVPFCTVCELHGHQTGTCSKACATCSKRHPPPCTQALCRICHKYGHTARLCPDTQCHLCGRWGHTSSDCPACKACGADHAPGQCGADAARCSRCGQAGHMPSDCTARLCGWCGQWGRGCDTGGGCRTLAAAAADAPGRRASSSGDNALASTHVNSNNFSAALGAGSDPSGLLGGIMDTYLHPGGSSSEEGRLAAAAADITISSSSQQPQQQAAVGAQDGSAAHSTAGSWWQQGSSNSPAWPDLLPSATEQQQQQQQQQLQPLGQQIWSPLEPPQQRQQHQPQQAQQQTQQQPQHVSWQLQQPAVTSDALPPQQQQQQQQHPPWLSMNDPYAVSAACRAPGGREPWLLLHPEGAARLVKELAAVEPLLQHQLLAAVAAAPSGRAALSQMESILLPVVAALATGVPVEQQHTWSGVVQLGELLLAAQQLLKDLQQQQQQQKDLQQQQQQGHGRGQGDGQLWGVPASAAPPATAAAAAAAAKFAGLYVTDVVSEGVDDEDDLQLLMLLDPSPALNL